MLEYYDDMSVSAELHRMLEDDHKRPGETAYVISEKAVHTVLSAFNVMQELAVYAARGEIASPYLLDKVEELKKSMKSIKV